MNGAVILGILFLAVGLGRVVYLGFVSKTPKSYKSSPLSIILDMFWLDIFFGIDFLSDGSTEEAQALPSKIIPYLKSLPGRVITAPKRFITYISTDTHFDEVAYFNQELKKNAKVPSQFMATNPFKDEKAEARFDAFIGKIKDVPKED